MEKTLDPWVPGVMKGGSLEGPELAKSERSQRKTETAMFLTNTGKKNKTTQHVYNAWNGLSSSSGIFCELCLEVSLFPGWIFGSSGIFVFFLGCYLKKFLGTLGFFLSIVVCFLRFFFLSCFGGMVFLGFSDFIFPFARRKSDRRPVRFLLSSLLPPTSCRPPPPPPYLPSSSVFLITLFLLCLAFFPFSPPSPSFYFFFLVCFFFVPCFLPLPFRFLHLLLLLLGDSACFFFSCLSLVGGAAITRSSATPLWLSCWTPFVSNPSPD